MFSLNELKKYYYSSPVLLKKIYATIPFSFRNGKEYKNWRSFLDEVNNDKTDYALLKIKETIEFAYNNIPYYYKLYKKYDIHPSDIKTFNDFIKLPIIDKNTISNNFIDLQNTKLSYNKYYFVTTGGTSGAPATFLQSNNVWKKELAFVYDLFEHFGYLPHMKKVSFRGGEFNNITRIKFWKQNPIYNETHFSPFHISENTIHIYIKKLNEIKAPLIHAYPSSIMNLMFFMKKVNRKLEYRPKIIILISEDILIDQIREIKSFFDCKVTSFYGHSERLIFAPNLNEALDSYSVDLRYGYMELLNKEGNVINSNNEEGEIVGTSFDNQMMPLIRYRTNDFTSYIDKEKLEINLIKGRWEQEYLIGNGNTKISLAAINLHSDAYKNILRYQFNQSKIGNCVLNCIVNLNFSNEDISNIEKELNNKTKNILDFKVKIVKELELTQRGKFKQLVNKIPKND